MSSNKRRKLDNNATAAKGPVTSSPAPSPAPPRLSAFAARQQLWGAAAALSRASSVDATLTAVVESKSAPERETQSETPSSRPPAATRRSKRQPLHEPIPSLAPKSPNPVTKESCEDGEQGGSHPTTPGPEPTARLIRQHSSFKPSKDNPKKKSGGRLVLTTREAERLVVIGSFGIRVREGEATISGAILTPADGIQWVHAPLCHAVPVIRTSEETVLEFHPHPVARGLRQLAHLNPVFGKLWEDGAREGESNSKSAATFQIIYTSDDLPKKVVLQELVSPAEWNKKLAALVASKRSTTPIIFLCGPKSSGKSTFGRLLVNRLMTDRGGVKNRPWSPVMFLDLDPGQPEYSPPGVVSLCKLTNPNLSPSFCHPTLSPTQGLIRAHATASVTPAQDPAHFLECALDLFSHYRTGPNKQSPLVINTPGWIQGTGLDLLTSLITSLQPTEVIYMSQDGPEETVSGLQTACKETIPFSTLPSQPSEPSPSSRTPLHLRTMQMMSYFHLRPAAAANTSTTDSQQPPLITWDPTPLSDLRPWRVRFAGRERGFLGVLCYDHQPAPELLADAVNGTVMALVGVERREGLRGLEAIDDVDDLNGFVDGKKKRAKTKAQEARQQDKDQILPLIPNPQGLTLSPAHSHLIALVLVRAVDLARGELQLLMPPASLLPPSTASFLPNSDVDSVGPSACDNLVLVAGRWDAPGWAYCESLFYASSSSSSSSSHPAGTAATLGSRGHLAAAGASAGAGAGAGRRLQQQQKKRSRDGGGEQEQEQEQEQEERGARSAPPPPQLSASTAETNAGGLGLGLGRGAKVSAGVGGGAGGGEGLDGDGDVDVEEEGDEEEEDEMVAMGEDDAVAAMGRGKSSAAAATAAQQLEVPWVEVLHGNQKRAVGSKVWRVRRDLGRSRD
ncbi:hypothetical protein VTJ04DRAFT_7126 [Mycothermus thermophilus]|uniref:uncharacterized protein n=1 Tax=Humicola insolens TaxID=85995 RepID=UPI003743EB3C